MKKSILFIAVIANLLPLTSTPICLRYVDGPSDLEYISAYSDATKAGSYFPTGGPFYKELQRGGPAQNFPDMLGKHAFITIKDAGLTRVTYDFAGKDLGTVKSAHSTGDILTRGEKLNNKASYEINIDANKNVTFKEVDSMCK